MARVTIILGWDGINFAYGVTTALMIVHLNLRGACHYHPLFHLARFFSSLTQMSPLPLKAFKSTLGSLPAAAVFLILNSKVGFAPKRLQIHHGFASSWRSLGRRSSQFFHLLDNHIVQASKCVSCQWNKADALSPACLASFDGTGLL